MDNPRSAFLEHRALQPSGQPIASIGMHLPPADAVASGSQLRTELSGCLALCAPSGMTDDARQEWLVAAGATLAGIPHDLLMVGCQRARAVADHPAKVVPTIMATVEAEWDQRMLDAARAPVELQPVRELTHVVRVPDEPNVTPDEAARIIDEFGLRMAGTRSPVVHRGPPRTPTAAEMAELVADFAKGRAA